MSELRGHQDQFHQLKFLSKDPGDYSIVMMQQVEFQEMELKLEQYLKAKFLELDRLQELSEQSMLIIL